MRRVFYLLFPVILVAGTILLSAYGGDEGDYPGGSPAGYTGSPGDGKDCVNCHGGTSSFVSGWITSDIPPEGYLPGNTYNITVTLTGSGDKGFQVSAQDISGNQMGTLIAGSGTHLNGGTKYVNQNNGTTANPAVWHFQWTAPMAGSGNVTFYGAFTVNKPVTKLSTLEVSEQSFIPLQISATASPQVIWAGDSSMIDVTVSGGSGNYTYHWISEPAGYSSGEKSNWVHPGDTTLYIITVDDGVTILSDSVTVWVEFHTGVRESGIEVNIYPNPADNYLVVHSAVKPDAISLSDLQGRPVNLRTTDEGFIDVSDIPPGIYILTVAVDNQRVVRKVIIE